MHLVEVVGVDGVTLGSAMSEIRQFPLVPVSPPGAEDHARAETQRNQALFAWADRVLAQLGLTQAIAAVNIVDELRKILLDVNRAEVDLAIRDALHPASGQRAAHFAHMKEGGLKRILKMRFDEAKGDRVKAIGRGAGTASSSVPDWTADLILEQYGAVRPLLANLIQFLRWHPSWLGVLGYDEFSSRVVIRKRPPWGDEPVDSYWTDHHELLVRVWFQSEDISANQGDVARAVQASARHNSFHPVRDYFDALTWDGTLRLDTWLITFIHADDIEYVRAIAPRFLISAVARTYQPGCKVDHILVLEGPQGKQKSEALRTLVGRDVWFADRLSHVGTKDAALETAGVLLIEIAEMDALTKASSSAIKSFLSRRHDRFRPPFGKHTINRPRQCVFTASVNPAAGGYLKDPTGARRIWPVACHGIIDCEGIAATRDQLWAEAVTRYKAGAKWWLESPELEALATTEQRARYVVDAWQSPIEDWLASQKDVSITEMLSGALNLSPAEQTQRSVNRVSAILTHAGFVRVRARKGPKRKNQRETRYRRES